MRKLITVVIALLMMWPVFASADTGSLSDPQDGGSQRIWDIESITHSHTQRAGTRLLRHTVRFYDDVRNTSFDEGFNGPGITFEFEFDKDKSGPERFAYFDRNEDGSLFVTVTDRKGELRGFANWYQPSPEEISIEFQTSLLRRGLDRYEWAVIAISGPPCEDTGAPADGCPDWTRRLQHDKP